MNNLDKQLNKITSRIDVEEFNRNAKEVFENEVVPQIKRAKEDNMTAVEWLGKELESYGDPGYCKIEWETLDLLIQQTKEMDKENLESLKDFNAWKEWKNNINNI